MLKKFLIISIVSLVLCPAVIAFDYFEIARNSKNDAYYLNFQNGFDQPATNIIGFWVKKNIFNSTPYSKENPITYSQQYFTVNCTGNSYYINKILYYKDNNEQIDGKSFNNASFKPAQQGTIGAKISAFACWYKKDIYDTHMAPGHTKYNKKNCPEFCHKEIQYCSTFYTCSYKLP